MARIKKYREANPEIIKERKKKYCQKNKDKVNAWNKKYIRKRKKDILIKLGGKCKNCGFDRVAALQIHHKIGKGKPNGKRYGGDYMRLKNYPLEGLEILCANCHAILHYE